MMLIRHIARLIVLAAAALICPIGAGQVQGPIPLSAQFGFDNTYVAGRWMPITVTLGPIERAIDGLLVVEFTQDASQKARILVPFATTPNRAIPIDVVAAIPSGCPEVKLSVVGGNGRELASRRYESIPVRGDPLPDSLPSGRGLIVSVGDTSLRHVVSPWHTARRTARTDEAEIDSEPLLDHIRYDDPETDKTATPQGTIRVRPSETQTEAPSPRSLRELASATIDADQLPRVWTAYDGVLALVINVRDVLRADPRSVRAVQEWVLAGGTLILIASDPGDGWRRWITPETGTAAVDLDPLGAVSIDESARAEISPRSGVTSAVREATGRAIRLSREAEKCGATLEWRVAGDSRAGLLARVPAGFGTIVILGAEPQRLLETVNVEAMRTPWERILQPILHDRAMLEPSERDRSQAFVSSPGNRTSHALAGTLASLAAVDPPGDGVFALVCIGLAVLAMLIGPFDAIVLKRKGLSHRSWLTATGWIVGGAGIAYTLPLLARSGPTTVNRVACVDVLPLESGEAMAFESAAVGIFMGQRATLRLGAMDTAAWARGVSPLDYEHFGPGPRERIAVFQTVQAAVSPPFNIPTDLSAGIWTFRTFIEERTATLPMTVLAASLEEGWRIEIKGLPAEYRVMSAWLARNDTWQHANTPLPESEVVDSLAFEFSREAISQVEPEEWQESMEAGFRVWGGPHLRAPSVKPGELRYLPGADRRAGAMRRYMQLADVGVLHLTLHHESPYRDVGVASVGKTDIAMRILVALPTPSDDAGRGLIEEDPSP